MMKDFMILAINPGSTSTKIAVFQNDEEIFIKNIKHPAEEIAQYQHVADQFAFRKALILQELEAANIDIQTLDAIVGRWGILKPIPSGVYEVNDAMIHDLQDKPLKEHASNLGALIARDMAASIPWAKAFIADPVVVDEFTDVARMSGHPLFKRESIFHALNQKAIARQHAQSVGKNYEEMNLIVVHMGGWVSIGAHHHGKVVDVNNAIDGEGPFSPERSGALPAGDLVRLCFSGKYTEEEMINMIVGKGGMVGFLGTNNAYDAEMKALAGDTDAKKVFEAFVYQVAKYIGAMATVLKCEVDAILLTGGMAKSTRLTDQIADRVQRLAPVTVYPGEDEMRALAINGLMALKGEMEILEYK